MYYAYIPNHIQELTKALSSRKVAYLNPSIFFILENKTTYRGNLLYSKILILILMQNINKNFLYIDNLVTLLNN